MDEFRKYQSAYVPVGIKFTENGAVALDSRIDRSVVGQNEEDLWKSWYMSEQKLDPTKPDSHAEATKAWKLRTSVSEDSSKDKAINGWLSKNAKDPTAPTPEEQKAANDWWTSKPSEMDLEEKTFNAYKSMYPDLDENEALLTFSAYENEPDKLRALSTWRSSDAYKSLATNKDQNESEIQKIERDLVAFLQDNQSMTLPEFESLQATAQDIVAKADAGEFKGSPEMVEDARQFIANAPNLKEGIIARQPLSDIEEKIVFTPIFEGGEQVGVQQNTVKIRGNKIFDAATDQPFKVTDANNQQIEVTTDSSSLVLSVRSSAEQERINDVTSTIEGNKDFKELVALRRGCNISRYRSL